MPDIKRAIGTVLALIGLIMIVWGVDVVLVTVSKSLDFWQLAQEQASGIHVLSIQGVTAKYAHNALEAAIGLVNIGLAICLFRFRGSILRTGGDGSIDHFGYAIGAHAALWAGGMFAAWALISLPIEYLFNYNQLIRALAIQDFQYQWPRALQFVVPVVLETLKAVLCIATAIALFTLRRKILNRDSLGGSIPSNVVEGTN